MQKFEIVRRLYVAKLQDSPDSILEPHSTNESYEGNFKFGASVDEAHQSSAGHDQVDQLCEVSQQGYSSGS